MTDTQNRTATRIHWTLLEPEATDEEMLHMDKEGYVEVEPERAPPTDDANQTAGEDEISRLRADRAKLIKVLEVIRKNRYGLDPSDTIEQQMEYWSKLVCTYRQIAAEALKELS